ncbi:hypothetical protein [Parvibaculum sp.]|uniref:hypothetical protein n=1 Tax=Parvibaculum sp. TaxID=2024848 RepID=UPI000C5F76E6|nr:hypothetical protein [Parvibaculum sp.]MAM95707.1 hypothetical protein [Parvibaculum sp.]|tara:strand:+ start:774 stop:1073 length:300 start_codon:yes stop_codon:yes gene_type:complete
MTAQPVRAAGMAWYTRQDYPRILEIMEDAEKLPPTYFAWSKAAERGKRDLERKGHIVITAIIDPDEFPVWCRARGLNIDAKARIQFANETAYAAINKTH